MKQERKGYEVQTSNWQLKTSLKYPNMLLSISMILRY